MSEIIEMLWGCTSCGSQKSRGRFKNCESCGAPRTPDSPEFMPDDWQTVEAVSDPGLLGKFQGGADWKCKYCDSSAFRADGSCAQCGSPQGDSTTAPAAPTEEPALVMEPEESSWSRRQKQSAAVLKTVAALVAALVLCGIWALFHERIYDVRVTKVAWQSTVHLERYAIHGHESFAEGIASGAFEKKGLGSRHHHDEKLLDHYVPVPYTVNEFAGYRTETYQTSESCGQSCYTTSRTCTSNKNGSATCTGGGQRCSTKYCSVTKTRQVSYTKPVVHIRQDPVYRYEPRFAEWYSWWVWEWAPDHDVVRSGTDTKITWPPETELALKLGEGEHQRDQKNVSMHVVFSHDDDRFDYVPKTEKEFGGLGMGTPHRIKKSAVGAVELLQEGK